MTLELLNLMVILAVMVGFLFLIKKFVKKKGHVMGAKSKYIEIVDTGMSISVGQRLSIVKVGEEYFMMTHGQNGVGFQKLDAKNLEEKKQKWEEEYQKQKSMFTAEGMQERFLKKKGEEDENK